MPSLLTFEFIYDEVVAHFGNNKPGNTSLQGGWAFACQDENKVWHWVNQTGKRLTKEEEQMLILKTDLDKAASAIYTPEFILTPLNMSRMNTNDNSMRSRNTSTNDILDRK